MASEQLFLSHAWAKDKLGRDNHKRVARLNDGLRARKVATWFDAQGDMAGNTLQAMTNGREFRVPHSHHRRSLGTAVVLGHYQRPLVSHWLARALAIPAGLLTDYLIQPGSSLAFFSI